MARLRFEYLDLDFVGERSGALNLPNEMNTMV